jgi:hypothetical protein
MLVQHIAANGRQGLSTTQATDTIWALTSAEVYLLLTADSRLTSEQYVEWLADTLIRLLLP